MSSKLSEETKVYRTIGLVFFLSGLIALSGGLIIAGLILFVLGYKDFFYKKRKK